MKYEENFIHVEECQNIFIWKHLFFVRKGRAFYATLYQEVSFWNKGAGRVLKRTLDRDTWTSNQSDSFEPQPLRPIVRNTSAQVQVTASDNECHPPHIPHPGRPPPSWRGSSTISPTPIRLEPLRPIVRNTSAQVQVTASDNECHPPHIPHPGRPPPSWRGSSTISPTVVFIIAAIIFIVGGLCLINHQKVSVRNEDEIQGVVVTVILVRRSGGWKQVSSVPVKSRFVIVHRQKGRFWIQSDGGGR